MYTLLFLIVLITMIGFFLIGCYTAYGAYKGYKWFVNPPLGFRTMWKKLGERGFRRHFIITGVAVALGSIWILIWVFFIFNK